MSGEAAVEGDRSPPLGAPLAGWLGDLGQMPPGPWDGRRGCPARRAPWRLGSVGSAGRCSRCVPTASMNVALYAGIAGGALAALILIGVLAYCCCCRRRGKGEAEDARP